MLKFRDLVKAETHFVRLNATPKPLKESEFIQLMTLPSKEQRGWFRAPTSRLNHAYQMHWYHQ